MLRRTDNRGDGPHPIGKFIYDTPAIQTLYSGIEFRSRLEARWAAFFDHVGWRWLYEPIDLDGWFPDFEIGEVGTLVEVKPFTSFDEFAEHVLPKLAKAMVAAPNCDVLLCGTDPRFIWVSECRSRWARCDDVSWDVFFDRATIGDISCTNDPEMEQIALTAEAFTWYDRITGEYDGNCTYPGPADEPENIARCDKAWKFATNVTKYRKPSHES